MARLVAKLCVVGHKFRCWVVVLFLKMPLSSSCVVSKPVQVTHQLEYHSLDISSLLGAPDWAKLKQGTRITTKSAEFHIVHIAMSHMCRPPHKALMLINRRQIKEKQPKPVRKQ